jgi:hypothetical protein
MFYQSEENIQFIGSGYQLNLTFANLGINNATQITRGVIDTYLQTLTTTPLPNSSLIYVTITETAVTSVIYAMYNCGYGNNFIADINIYDCNLIGYSVKNNAGYSFLQFDGGNPCQLILNGNNIGTLPLGTASAFATMPTSLNKIPFLGKSVSLNVSNLINATNNTLRVFSLFSAGVGLSYDFRFAITKPVGSCMFQLDLRDFVTNVSNSTNFFNLPNDAGTYICKIPFVDINVGLVEYLIDIVQYAGAFNVTYQLETITCVYNPSENIITPQLEINTN